MYSLDYHRSALSALIGNNIASDESIKHPFKGAYKLRPLRSKYSTTWNPQLAPKKASSLTGYRILQSSALPNDVKRHALRALLG